MIQLVIPESFVHIGWIHEIEWVDGWGSPTLYAVDKKPKSYKEWPHAHLHTNTILSEHIRPVFAPE